MSEPIQAPAEPEVLLERRGSAGLIISIARRR